MEMVYNVELEKEIPVGWESRELGQTCQIHDNLRKPLSGIEREKMNWESSYYSAMSIVDYVNDYILNGTFLFMSEDGVIVIDKDGYPAH
jgi:type I restriction enzyme S subunit